MALFIDKGVGGVDVFPAGGLCLHGTSPKGDYAALQVDDGEHYPVAENVNEAALAAALGKTCAQQLVLLIAHGAKMVGQGTP